MEDFFSFERSSQIAMLCCITPSKKLILIHKPLLLFLEKPTLYWISSKWLLWENIALTEAIFINLLVAFFYPFSNQPVGECCVVRAAMIMFSAEFYDLYVIWKSHEKIQANFYFILAIIFSTLDYSQPLFYPSFHCVLLLVPIIPTFPVAKLQFMSSLKLFWIFSTRLVKIEHNAMWSATRAFFYILHFFDRFLMHRIG